MSLPDFFTKGHNKVAGRAGVAKLSANGTVVLPKGSMLDRIYIKNRTANAVTGGIKIGTTSGGTEVLAAVAVGANAVVRFTPTIDAYSTADQTLYIQAVTSWNSAVVDVIVEYTEVTRRSDPISNILPAATYK